MAKNTNAIMTLQIASLCSVWVDAATGDSASLLYKNRTDRVPANGAPCMSFSIERLFTL